MRELNSEAPIKILRSRVYAPEERETLWKNLCVIGWQSTECVLEFSRTDKKFFVVAWELNQNRYHVIELFRSQANKLLHVCDSDLEKVMRLLEFKSDKLVVKNFELIMSYEQFMPSKAAENYIWPKRDRQ